MKQIIAVVYSHGSWKNTVAPVIQIQQNDIDLSFFQSHFLKTRNILAQHTHSNISFHRAQDAQLIVFLNKISRNQKSCSWLRLKCREQRIRNP